MKFKCIHTGSIYVFESEHDVEQMKQHPEYEQVVQDSEEPVKAPPVKRTYTKQSNKE